MQNKFKVEGSIEEYIDLNTKIYGHQRTTALIFGITLFLYSVLIFAFRPGLIYYTKSLYYENEIELGYIVSFLLYFVILVMNWPKNDDDHLHKNALI